MERKEEVRRRLKREEDRTGQGRRGETISEHIREERKVADRLEERREDSRESWRG